MRVRFMLATGSKLPTEYKRHCRISRHKSQLWTQAVYAVMRTFLETREVSMFFVDGTQTLAPKKVRYVKKSSSSCNHVGIYLWLSV